MKSNIIIKISRAKLTNGHITVSIIFYLNENNINLKFIYEPNLVLILAFISGNESR